MPRKALAPEQEELERNKEKERKEEEKPPRGLWEREPGSGVWWIRFRDADGKLHREKVGRKSDAQALLDKRRNDRRAGKKMPENVRTAPIKFEKLANYITEEYSDKHHSDSRNVKQRLEKLKAHFGDRAAESIKPAEIDKWLSKNTKTGSTANRYRAAMSLAYREGILSQLRLCEPPHRRASFRTTPQLQLISNRRRALNVWIDAFVRLRKCGDFGTEKCEPEMGRNGGLLRAQIPLRPPPLLQGRSR